MCFLYLGHGGGDHRPIHLIHVLPSELARQCNASHAADLVDGCQRLLLDLR